MYLRPVASIRENTVLYICWIF